MSSGRSCTGSVFFDRLSARTTTRSAATYSTTPGRLATTTAPESRATTCSIPVPTSGASGWSTWTRVPRARSSWPSVRVTRDHVLHPGTDQRRLGLQERHRLALHIRPHERAIRVVVLEERDQRRGHRHELLRRHVHEVQLLGRNHPELPALARRDPLLDEAAVPVDLGVGLGDDKLLLLERGQEHDLVGDAPLDDLPVWRLDEAELVRSRVGRE